MASPSVGRSPAARSAHLALMFLGGAAVLVGAVEMVLVVVEPVAPVWQLVLFLLVAWTYLAAGIVAWWRRPSNRMGAIMVAGCFALLVAGLANTSVPGLVAVGLVGATVILAVLIHLLHAFPSGRLHGAASRLTVLAGYGVSVILQAPLYLFTAAPPPYDVLMVSDLPDVADAGASVQRVAGAAVVVVTAVILAQRLRRADPARRQVLVPLFAYGIVAVLFIPVSSLIQPLLGFSSGTLTVLQLIVIGGVPIAFALGVLRGGFARTGEVEELGTWLGVSGGARPTLNEALAQTSATRPCSSRSGRRTATRTSMLPGARSTCPPRVLTERSPRSTWKAGRWARSSTTQP